MRKLYVLLVVAMALSLSTAALAQGTTYTADLDPLNSSEASGSAEVMVDGNMVIVTIESSGMSPNLPHAQHIHIGGENVCPPMSADDNGNGLISTPEGKPFYGGIEVSLTTEGSVGPESALAVERFPVADADGDISYSRTFQLPEGVTAEDISNGVIVQHGISELFGDAGKYDGEKMSEIPGANLPFEATVPALCGELQMMAGMPDTGAGGMADTAGVPVMALALIGAVLAGGVLMVARAASSPDYSRV